MIPTKYGPAYANSNAPDIPPPALTLIPLLPKFRSFPAFLTPFSLCQKSSQSSLNNNDNNNAANSMILEALKDAFQGNNLFSVDLEKHLYVITFSGTVRNFKAALIRILELKIATNYFINRLAMGEYDPHIIRNNKEKKVYLYIPSDDEGLKPFVSHMQKIAKLEKKREKLAQILFSVQPSQLDEITKKLEKINDKLAMLGGITASAGIPAPKEDKDIYFSPIPDSSVQDLGMEKWSHISVILKNDEYFCA